VALRSPNGARLTVASDGAPAVIVGALVNATAAGQAAAAAANAAESGVTVIACGERARGGSRRRRFAAEDLLGAGAVAHATGIPLSGEAVVAARAFRSCRDDLARTLLATDSGRELETAGFADDVRHAASLDIIEDVPILVDGIIRAG
jgi:2-phosphosulfolactate phosphatase